jgi:Na+/alanine symporter
VKPLDAGKSRALSILVTAACLALGTITVVRHTGSIWPFAAGVFYGIAVINITAEILLWKRASRSRRKMEEKKAQQSTFEDRDNGNSAH